MNGVWLLLPFLMVRVGLLFIVSRHAFRRAGYFAPRLGGEKVAYYIYQMSNLALFLYLLFLRVHIDGSLYTYSGAICYGAGLVLCIVSVLCFAFPNREGFNTKGIYRFSRHPMYLAYFVCFIGMALLTRSFTFFVVVIIFQIASHWIVLSEERWCVETFGASYEAYMERVRRYI